MDDIDGVVLRDDERNVGDDNNACDDKLVVVDGVERVVVLLDDVGMTVVEKGRLDVIIGDVSGGCIFEVA